MSTSAPTADQIPPASFSLIVHTFATQAMVALGMMENPMTKQTDVQPAMAKHFIDSLDILAAKTKGNLTDDEAKLIESAAHQLRMAYMALPKK